MAVSRFQVMAMLQAARAYVLGLRLESAYSWGLNRAIFIAAAKRGFKGGGAKSSKGSGVYSLGDEMAYKRERKGILLFTIGGEIQTREEFEKRVASRFGTTFKAAWKDALAYVRTFDRQTLLSAKSFFKDVYRPRRDELAEAWTEAVENASPRSA